MNDYSNMTSMEKLNYFRNLYYADGNTTENGIIANALNDVLPPGELDKLKITKKVQKAINTLDEVIPHPDNKMVDWKHLGIARAWQTIKETLVDRSIAEKEDRK